ncbi:MAG TPA: DinB family protein [Gemmatimonadales bacterium]|nr:DinB family protein [Gemmatimonadales bacterium]
MTSPLPEPWLRGPLPGIPAGLQPVAHALVASREDVAQALDGLTTAQLWQRPGGAAAIGWHVLHLAGSTDRLCTYARGEALTETQRAALARERELPAPPPALEELRAEWERVVERALAQLAGTPESALDDPRPVGRAQLPSTVRGLLFHAAEHSRRHVGQIVTTAKIIRGLALA